MKTESDEEKGLRQDIESAVRDAKARDGWAEKHRNARVSKRKAAIDNIVDEIYDEKRLAWVRGLSLKQFDELLDRQAKDSAMAGYNEGVGDAFKWIGWLQLLGGLISKSTWSVSMAGFFILVIYYATRGRR